MRVVSEKADKRAKDKRRKWVIDCYQENKTDPKHPRYIRKASSYADYWRGKEGYKKALSHMAKINQQGFETVHKDKEARVVVRTFGDAVQSFIEMRKQDPTASNNARFNEVNLFKNHLEKIMIDDTLLYDCDITIFDKILTNKSNENEISGHRRLTQLMNAVQKCKAVAGTYKGQPLADKGAREIFDKCRGVFLEAYKNGWIEKFLADKNIFKWKTNKTLVQQIASEKFVEKIPAKTWDDISDNWNVYSEICKKYEPSSFHFIESMCQTGCRPQELLALKANLSDFETTKDGGMQLDISKAIKHTRDDDNTIKKITSVTKTKHGDRFVPVHSDWVKELKTYTIQTGRRQNDVLFGAKEHRSFDLAWKKVQFIKNGWSYRYTGKHTKFHQVTKIPYGATEEEIDLLTRKNPGGVQRDVTYKCKNIKEIIEKTGVHLVRLYDLRSVYLTMLRNRGFSFEEIAKFAGHHNINVTKDHYFRKTSIPNAKEKARQIAGN